MKISNTFILSTLYAVLVAAVPGLIPETDRLTYPRIDPDVSSTVLNIADFLIVDSV